MALPFFYIVHYDPSASFINLNEETSKHIVQVLRMKEGEQLNLTDGKGNLLTAKITTAHKKNCAVSVVTSTFTAQAARKVSIAMSLVKNASRFEWFLEKATEIGVTEIIPLICERTERQHFRYERMKGILISAMLQSQQTWLPVLREPVKFEEYVENNSLLTAKVDEGYSHLTSPSDGVVKLIAHCEETQKQSITKAMEAGASMYNILIGPEGDFTKTEIELALKNHYQPVTLGETRLRAETAGMVAAALLCIS